MKKHLTLLLTTFLLSYALSAQRPFGYSVFGSHPADDGFNTNRTYAIAVENDGKVVVLAGVGHATSADFLAIYRYNQDGSPDTTLGLYEHAGTNYFTHDGKVVYENQGPAKTMALQKDNKILLGCDGFVERLNQNGTVDSTFGSNGRASTPGPITAIALQSSGKILVLAFNEVWRFLPDGSLDPAFGDSKGFAGGPGVSNIFVQPNDKFILATLEGLMRYNADGLLDTSFHTTAYPNATQSVSAIDQAPDGKIVVAGSHDNGTNLDFAVARYNADGSLDARFGSGGVAFADFNGGDDKGQYLSAQTDGKVVVGGTAFVPRCAGCIGDAYGLARFSQDGSLDASFGNGGKIVMGQNLVVGGMAFWVDKIYITSYTAASAKAPGSSAYVDGLQNDAVFMHPYPNAGTPLAITAPPALTLNSIAGTCGTPRGALGTPTVSGSCSPSYHYEAPDTFQVGNNQVRWIVRDACGNTQTAVQQVTVRDSSRPVVSVPSHLDFCFDSAGYNIPALTATDNCSVPTVSYVISGATTRAGNGNNASGAFKAGQSTITWIVTDNVGNRDSAQTVVVVRSPIHVTISASPNSPYLELTANVTGGTGPYQYLWNTGETMSTISPNGSLPPGGSVSFHIEAENWAFMSGVQLERTSDVGGGLDVGFIDPNDYMAYTQRIPVAGTYKVSFRVATPAQNGKLQLIGADGAVVATLSVPNTGGWQNWQTISTTVNLPEGYPTFRIVCTSPQYNGWNFNWWELQYIPETGTGTTSSNASFKVEAENYTSMSGVAQESTTDSLGGQDVGYIDTGDWMNYSITAPTAGTYTVQFRIATPARNAQFQVQREDGTVLTTVKLPNTGGYQNWQTVAANVNLDQGTQTLRLVSTAPQWNNWNINWMTFSTSASGGSGGSTPVHVEAENYTAMSGVATEPTQDAGGGQDVGYIDPADWMMYDVNVPANGNYTLSARIATPADHASMQVQDANGNLLATLTLPNTGGYQRWQTVTATVPLLQGIQKLKLVSTSPQWNNWNINWLELSYVSSSISNASYSVVVTDSFGCQATATWNPTPATAPTVASRPQVALLEVAPAHGGLQVYPNPSSGQFNLGVTLFSGKEPARLRIFNALGAQIEERMVSHSGVIQLGSAYRPGVYYAELVQGSNRATVTLVKTAQ